MMKILISTLMLTILVGGCAQEKPSSTDTQTPVAVSELDDAAWAEALIDHREEIAEDFKTSITSPMAGTQYLKSEPGERVYLTREDRTFGLADTPGPEAELVAEMKEGIWYWDGLGDDVVCQVDGEQVPTGSALESPATLAIAGLNLRFYPSDDRVTFIVFDPERPEMKSFDHLLYFPPDRSYEVPAKLVKLAEPEELEIPTTRGLIKTFYRYAKIHFEMDGEKQELTALKSALTGDDSEGLFIPFKDATTGRETYGAGRYLQIDEPEAEDFVLDFNRAYNPLCNYSPAYNCTLPPHENHLKVAIRAGELTYPH